MINRFVCTAISLACLWATGCSTLGLSLYPSGQFLTTEAEDVLNASRIQPGLPKELAKTPLPDHTIEPGDVLLIEALDTQGDIRLPADQAVVADGTVDLGLYGRVRLTGLTMETAEQIIERQIRDQLNQRLDWARQSLIAEKATEKEIARRDQEHRDLLNRLAINVRLIEPVHHYYVLGEVNAPGSFPLSGHETVLDAIVAAGGLTSASDPCKILLSRPTDPCDCRITLPICYREIVQLGNTSSNYQIRPGDRVFVATRSCMDEIMFWRATNPCPRCEGCNTPCRDASMVTTSNEFSTAEVRSIAPGSHGFHVSPSPPSDPSLRTMLEQEPPGIEPMPTDQEWPTPLPEETMPAPSRLPADTGDAPRLDGELDFGPEL